MVGNGVGVYCQGALIIGNAPSRRPKFHLPVKFRRRAGGALFFLCVSNSAALPQASAATPCTEAGSGQRALLHSGQYSSSYGNERVVLKDLASGETRVVRRGEAAFGVIVQQVDAHSSVIAVGTDSFAVAPGNFLVTFGAPTALTTDAQAKVVFIDQIGLIGVNQSTRMVPHALPVVLLHDCVAETFSAVEAGSGAFGYRTIQVTSRGVVLTTDALGRPGQSSVATKGDIPDLLALPFLERDHWTMEWRRALELAPKAEQAAAQEQMRTYWRRQLEGDWGTAVSKTLTAESQTRLRVTLARYWR